MIVDMCRTYVYKFVNACGLSANTKNKNLTSAINVIN